MNRIGKLALVAGILALALAVPIATAHLIYVYEAQVTVQPVTPLLWLNGTSSEVSAVNLELTNKSNPQISLDIPITNSTETYVYQALRVEALASSPYLYVANCSYSGPNLTSVELIVYAPTLGQSPTSPAGKITITPSSTSCTSSGSVQLAAGTIYYVDFAVQPSLPIPYGASSGTLTLYIGVSNQGGGVALPYP